jgi:hypothetical protein
MHAKFEFRIDVLPLKCDIRPQTEDAFFWMKNKTGVGQAGQGELKKSPVSEGMTGDKTGKG